MESVRHFAENLNLHLGKVLTYPLNPVERIFVLYLFSSLAFAIVAYVCSSSFKNDRQTGRSFISGLFTFVFPKAVWEHPSAWVDVRFFLPHQFLRLWIYTDFVAMFVLGTHKGSLSFLQSIVGTESVYTISANNIFLNCSFALVSFLLVDFAAFLLHYLQHKIPILWEFHKIHHSAEVLHPLSNYREHPIDNFSYAIGTGIASGLGLGAFHFFFGVKPLGLLIPILGVNVASFAFNLFGYNLRHSHIWVRWPGLLAVLFGCPAHHQIHHSYKPKHINKNFAFMFPMWDVMFGTFYLPKREEELDIGIGDGTEREYNSYAAIYTLPFLNLFRSLPKALKGDLSKTGQRQPKAESGAGK